MTRLMTTTQERPLGLCSHCTLHSQAGTQAQGFGCSLLHLASAPGEVCLVHLCVSSAESDMRYRADIQTGVMQAVEPKVHTM